MIGQTLGHYRIVEKIGAGGMGEVYRAHDEQLERDVALKVLPKGALLDDAARRRFRKEALALARLNHPNIETVFEFGTQDGVDFLVTEYIPGVTLSERLASGPLTEKELLRLGPQLAEGLAAAHEQNVVHRDLKPANLRVTPDERLKVLDFGLARLLRPAGDQDVTASVTETHATAGTLAYMAPEQLRGELADKRTDIYATGAVLYEMATARRPFPQTYAPQLTDAILHQLPVPPQTLNPHLSPEWERIALKCLEKDPENRYQSARELVVDLRNAGTRTAPALAQPIARPKASWGQLGLAGGTAVVVLAGILLLLNIGRWRERLFGRAAPSRIESLAVLPLENLSGDPSQSYLADGMTEELITDLGQISALRVISRTSVMHYKGTQKTVPEIARELHVDAVVEGSVERAGDEVRITAQLIQAPTDRHLWARSYRRDLRNALQLQDEVAQAVAREIEVKLTPQEQTRLTNSHRVDPEAYNDYLKGRYFYDQATPETNRKANEYFQQAIKKDPYYAPAWALWADTAWDPALSRAENAKRSRDALQKALELDDSLPEVHTSIGAEKMDEWDWAGAERELRRAIEVNPNYAEAHHVYSHYLMGQGRPDDSFRESQRAIESDPLNLFMTTHLGWYYLFVHEYDQAIAQCRRTLDLDPNYQLALGLLAFAEEKKGEYADAIAAFQKVINLGGGNEGSLLGTLTRQGHAYALAGNKEQALKIVDRLLHLAGNKALSQPEGNVSVSYDLAILYLGLGDKEKSLAFLAKAVEEHAISAFDPVNRDPLFDTLHTDPRFQDLLRRIGLPP